MGISVSQKIQWKYEESSQHGFNFEKHTWDNRLLEGQQNLHTVHLARLSFHECKSIAQ